MQRTTVKRSRGFGMRDGLAAVIMLSAVAFSFTQACAQSSDGKEKAIKKQISQARDYQNICLYLEQLKTLYFQDNRYSDFVSYLEILGSTYKNTNQPCISYYVALSRYKQLRYLEESQGWEEYFNNGNEYRNEVTENLKLNIDSLSALDPLYIYSRLLLWKFHKDQDDASADSALSALLDAVTGYCQQDKADIRPLKEVADELLAYSEKSKAKEIYRIYVNKLASSGIGNAELNDIAMGFYKEGNIELSEAVFDLYIEKLKETYPSSQLRAELSRIAGLFAYRDNSSRDAYYAEKVFRIIEQSAGGKEAFDEDMLYLRAYNLEKAKDYRASKDVYKELIERFPSSRYSRQAKFKLGIIYAYVLADIPGARGYFEPLAEEGGIDPYIASALYQLGVLSQWEGDLDKAKQYYLKITEDPSAPDFLDTVNKANDRLKEIEEGAALNYNLKLFLDVCFSAQDYPEADMSRSTLISSDYRPDVAQSVNIESSVYSMQSGCLQVSFQYLWSGSTGEKDPSAEEQSFDTSYSSSGTKEINLIVVGPAGIVDRNIDMLDVN